MTQRLVIEADSLVIRSVISISSHLQSEAMAISLDEEARADTITKRPFPIGITLHKMLVFRLRLPPTSSSALRRWCVVCYLVQETSNPTRVRLWMWRWRLMFLGDGTRLPVPRSGTLPSRWFAKYVHDKRSGCRSLGCSLEGLSQVEGNRLHCCDATTSLGLPRLDFLEWNRRL